MDAEISSFIKEMKDSNETIIQGIKYYSGKLFNKDVVLAKSGMGKVNVAMTLTLLLEHFNIDLVINIGLGGGNGKYVSKGDFVISDKVSYHDIDCTANNEYLYGQMQDYPLFFEASKEVIDKITSLNKDIIVGGILTGDAFITNQSYIKERLDYFETYENFKPMVFEMEGASIGQVCYRSKTPFVIIRYVSDVASSTNQYGNYKEAKTTCSDVLVDVVKEYLSI